MPAKSRRGKVNKRSKTSGKRAVKNPKAPWPQRFRPVQAPREAPIEPGDLPDSYGDTKVVLLPVDPYLVHVYWDVAPGELEKTKTHLGEGPQHVQATLRFYDITSIIFDGSNAHSVFDVDIELQARNWYVHLWSPERSYCVDLGFRTKDGRFVPIARSNVAETPRAWPLERGEERFMLVTGNYERVEILPQQIGCRISNLQPPTSSIPHPASHIRSAGQTEHDAAEKERPTEPQRARPIDSAELLRRKLAEFYRLRRWGKPPLQPPFPPTRSLLDPLEEGSHLDLTEISERKFTAGLSSKR